MGHPETMAIMYGPPTQQVLGEQTSALCVEEGVLREIPTGDTLGLFVDAFSGGRVQRNPSQECFPYANR